MGIADRLTDLADRLESTGDVLNTTSLDTEVKELRALALRARVWQVGAFADDEGYLWEKGGLTDWVSAFRHPYYDKTGELKNANRDVVGKLVDEYANGNEL